MYHSIRMGIGERKVRELRMLSALVQIAVGNLVSSIGNEIFPNISNISGHMQVPCQLYFGYSYVHLRSESKYITSSVFIQKACL